MICPFCGDDMSRKRRGPNGRFRKMARSVAAFEDSVRGAYLRVRRCGKCGARVIFAEIPFPQDRQEEELHRLSSLQYAARVKPVQPNTPN
jgi:hypothetical protein